MSLQSRLQVLMSYLTQHVPFDIALGVVVGMVLLSFAFTIVNRPKRVLSDKSIVGALASFKASNDTDQIKLLWEYALHSDGVFNDRQNFFLLFESVLLGGTFAMIGATAQKPDSTLNTMLIIVAFLGLLTTVSWWYVQLRQEYVLDCLTEFHKSVTPVYADVISRVRQKPYRMGSTLILVYALPVLVGLLWATILLIV